MLSNRQAAPLAAAIAFSKASSTKMMMKKSVMMMVQVCMAWTPILELWLAVVAVLDLLVIV
jgi:hypothetical protein